MHWTHQHFTGITHVLLPLLTYSLSSIGLDWDNRTKTQGVFRIVSKRHKGWSKNVDKERGNYDYLLGVDVSSVWLSQTARASHTAQIDHRHPEVRKDMFAWGSWVLDVSHPYTSIAPA